MYTNIEQFARRLGIKQTRSPRGSQMWECWADRVLEAHRYDQTILLYVDRAIEAHNAVRRDEMIKAANSYA